MAATHAAALLDPAERAFLVRRGLRLEYLTLAWNSLEAVIAIAAGWLAGSIALIGFGLDSLIEMSIGDVLLWRLSSDADPARRARAESRALQLVGWSFLLLAAYVAFDATRSLWLREAPDQSTIGIILAAFSLIVMPLLARAKRRIAARIASRALHADSRQTSICAFLSAILLAGLLLNAFAGWWWADPIAALLMVPIIAREGWEALRGDRCEDCSRTA